MKNTPNPEPEQKDPENHPYVGTTVGQYRIEQLIGGGSMGLVFRAHQNSVNRHVAIKFLSYHHKGDELSSRRLEREAQAMGKLNHPGLVSTYEFGITDYGQPFIIMEYLKGETLCDLLSAEGVLEKNRALRFTRQIAEAMDYAHRNGVIHRDLKPANIMVMLEPWKDHLKIYDFGIARLTADSQLLTRPGMVLGSPAYMSPEQCKGKETDCRSDIYSLGVILYSSISGAFPVNGDGGHMTMLNKIKHDPTMLSHYVPDVHPALEKLIMKMIAIDPGLRPQTMSHVINEITKIMEANALESPRSEVKSLIGKRNKKDNQKNSTMEKKPKILFKNKNQLSSKLSSRSKTNVIHCTSILLLLGLGTFFFSPPGYNRQIDQVQNKSGLSNLKVADEAREALKEKTISFSSLPAPEVSFESNPALKAGPLSVSPVVPASPRKSRLDLMPIKKTPVSKPTVKGVNYRSTNTYSRENDLIVDKSLKQEFYQFLRLKQFRKEKQKRFPRRLKGNRITFQQAENYGNTPYNQIHSPEIFLR